MTSDATVGFAVGPAPSDPRHPSVVRDATGLLAALNAAGVLAPSDVHVALRVGRLLAEDDERVLLAVALAVRAVRHGSVCVDLAAAVEIEPGVAWPALEAWRAAVATSPVCADGGVLVGDGDDLYLRRYRDEETQVVDDLRARRRTTPDVDAALLATAADELFPAAAFADQRAAAEAACAAWTSVITGGPGTGKTTTVARLLGLLHRVGGADRGLRIALAAPTGKAAARMTQALREALEHEDFPGDLAQALADVEAVTLHRLLGWRSGSRSRFRHHRGNRLPHDVVVVDETSMVSLTMMARLLEAVRPDARLVLVGDHDQLASVEAGAVLGDLVRGLTSSPRPGLPVATLTTTRRFGAEIGDLAAAIRRGDVEGVLAALAAGGDSVVRLPVDDLPALLAQHARATHETAIAGDPGAALAALQRHQLLCAHRDGPWGAAWWNRRTERLLIEALGRDWLGEWYAGRPFVVNANDYGLQLFNGDAGVVAQVPSDDGLAARLVAAIDTGAQARLLPTTRLADVSTAHALTVHRSQGSQFDEVTVLLPEVGSRILTRELIYTAVTRAKQRVRVVGSDEAIRAALTQRAARASRLAERL